MNELQEIIKANKKVWGKYTEKEWIKKRTDLIERFMDGESPERIGLLLRFIDFIEFSATGNIRNGDWLDSIKSKEEVKTTKKAIGELVAAWLGKCGGQATLKKYGKEKMTEWGKRGGRPKKA